MGVRLRPVASPLLFDECRDEHPEGPDMYGRAN
jgi:hypothetical protein